MLNYEARQKNLFKIAASGGLLSSFVEQHLNKEKPKFIPLTSVGPGTSVYMNQNAIHPDGSVDIIVNFRGVSGDPAAVSNSFGGANAVVVSAEAVGPQKLNMGSKLLEQQFGSAQKLNEIVGKVLAYLQKINPDKQIKRGKLAVSGFSGGGSIVSRLVNERSQIPGGIDTVVINDGLHADQNTKDGKARLDALVQFAREAQKDPNKKFKILHSAIDPKKYPSSTMTANYILQQLGLERQKTTDPDQYKSYGFIPVSTAKSGGVEVTQMFDNPNLKYDPKNTEGTLGATHLAAIRKGNPYLFRDIFQNKS